MPTPAQRNRIQQAAVRLDQLEQIETRIQELDRRIAKEQQDRAALVTQRDQLMAEVDADLADLRR